MLTFTRLLCNNLLDYCVRLGHLSLRLASIPFTIYPNNEINSPTNIRRGIMENQNEERFINIETKISHQEVMLEELHQVIYQQQEQIDLLNKNLKLFVQQMTSDSEIRPAGEKPPHY